MTYGTAVFFWMAQRVRLNPKNDLKRLGIRVKSKRKNVILDPVLTPYLTPLFMLLKTTFFACIGSIDSIGRINHGLYIRT